MNSESANFVCVIAHVIEGGACVLLEPFMEDPASIHWIGSAYPINLDRLLYILPSRTSGAEAV